MNRTIGMIAIAAIAVVALAGILSLAFDIDILSAIEETKVKYTVYNGYTLFVAEDTEDPTHAEWIYVRGYWNHRFEKTPEGLQAAYAFIDELIATSPKCVWAFKVTDKNDVPMAGVHVIVTRDGESVSYLNEVTDGDGIKRFFDFPIGSWNWKAVITGAQTKSTSPVSLAEEGKVYWTTVKLDIEVVVPPSGEPAPTPTPEPEPEPEPEQPAGGTSEQYPGETWKPPWQGGEEQVENPPTFNKSTITLVALGLLLVFVFIASVFIMKGSPT